MAARAALFSVFFLATCLATQTPDLLGYWEGSIIISPAENELDVVAELSRDGKGELQGRLWFPTHPVGPFDIESLSFHGASLSFQVRDKDDVVSRFQGEIRPDGKTIRGTFQEKLQSYPFALARRSAPPAVEPAIRDLADDASELKSDFHRASGHVRLLLVLSPISLSAKVALRLVERYVLEEMPDPALRVYVVWEVPDVPGAQTLIPQRFKPLVGDLRVVEFWSRTGAATNALASLRSVGNDRSMNRCFLFSSDQTWGENAPVPSRVWQSTRLASQPEPPEAQRFDAADVARAVRALLVSKPANRR